MPITLEITNNEKYTDFVYYKSLKYGPYYTYNSNTSEFQVRDEILNTFSFTQYLATYNKELVDNNDNARSSILIHILKEQLSNKFIFIPDNHALLRLPSQATGSYKSMIKDIFVPNATLSLLPSIEYIADFGRYNEYFHRKSICTTRKSNCSCFNVERIYSPDYCGSCKTERQIISCTCSLPQNDIPNGLNLQYLRTQNFELSLLRNSDTWEEKLLSLPVNLPYIIAYVANEEVKYISNEIDETKFAEEPFAGNVEDRPMVLL